MLYKIMQNLKDLLYKLRQQLNRLLCKIIGNQKSLLNPTPSFPRRRESILTIRSTWIPVFTGMTDKKKVAIYA